MKAILVFSCKDISLDGRNLEEAIKQEVSAAMAQIKASNKDADVSGIEAQVRAHISSKYSAEKLFLKTLLMGALKKTTDIFELAAIVNYAKSLSECNGCWTIEAGDIDKYLKKSLDRCEKEPWWLYLDGIISQLISPKFDAADNTIKN